MNFSIFTPDIDKKMETYVRLSCRKNRDPENIGPSITLSSNYGCNTEALSMLLKYKLEDKYNESFHLVDQQYIEDICKEYNIPISRAEHIEQINSLSDVFGSFQEGAITQSELFSIVKSRIRDEAESGYCIIIGRGAAIYTQDINHCYKYHIDASLDYRVAVLAENLQIKEEQARETILQYQEQHERFIKHELNDDLDSIDNYELIFNLEKTNINFIAETIINDIDNKFQKPHFSSRHMDSLS